MFYWKKGLDFSRMGVSITIMSILSDRLSEEILQARQRVYTVGEPPPLQRLHLPGIKARYTPKGRIWAPSGLISGAERSIAWLH